MTCNCEEAAKKGKQKVEESLAMRLVQDTRKQSKRWFIAWLVTFLTLLIVIGGIVYIVLTSDISAKTITQDGNGVNSYIGNERNQVISRGMTRRDLSFPHGLNLSPVGILSYMWHKVGLKSRRKNERKCRQSAKIPRDFREN